jgi:hypothetical protein
VSASRIETRPFFLAPRDILRLIALLSLRRSWPIILLLAGVGVWLINRSLNWLDIVVGVVALLSYPLAVMTSFSKTLRGRAGRLVAMSRTVALEDDTIHLRMQTGAESSHRLQDFLKTSEVGDYFLLYVSRLAYVVIDKRAFASSDDVEAFRQALQNRQVQQGRTRAE